MESMESQDDLKFPFSDFIKLLKKHKKFLIISMIVGSSLCFLLAVTRPVNYLVQATFRDKGKTQANIHSSLTELLISPTSSQDSETISVMKSRFLLSKVIKRLQIQGKITKVETEYPELNNAKDNLFAEWAYWNNYQIPILDDPEEGLVLNDISFDKETKGIYVLKFTDSDAFEVKSENGALLGTGKIDEAYSDKGTHFTVKNPTNISPEKGDLYLVVIEPMVNMVNLMAKDLVISVDRDDKSLLKLQFKNRDRHFAKNFLDTLMDTYQRYLEDDHELSSAIQVNYLEKRQKDAGNALEALMEAYVKNVSNDMSQSGFTSLQQEMDFLAANLASNQQKLTEIQLETMRLKNVNCDECVHYDSYTGRGDPAIINHLLAEIRTLKQESDALALTLHDRTIGSAEFDGITLETSRHLYLSFMQDLNTLEAEEKQHRFVLEQLSAPDFELSSLTALLKDPVSHERIANATQIVINLKDEDNRTLKELDRLGAELQLQKTFLHGHIFQMANLLKLKTELIRDKLAAIRNVTLALIDQQTSVLKKQLVDYLERRIDNLSQEKKLLEDHQAALHSRMASIPPKWASEQLLNQNLNLQQRFLENLANMVESKNITKNLEMIQSSPLDHAIAPLHPKNPRLLFYSAFGAILGLLGSSSFLFSRAMIQGITASADNLQLAHFHVSGTISPFQGDAISATMPLLDSDLDTLRRLLARFEQESSLPQKAKLILVANGNGPDFSNTLSKLLAKKWQTTLKLDLNFQTPSEHQTLPGLLQYLEGKVDEPEIEEMDGFDQISPGGTSRYSEELLRSSRFIKLLDKLKPAYHWIVAVSPAKIPSAELENLAKLFDGIVVVVTNETLQNLVAFSKTLDQTRKNALTFVISNFLSSRSSGG